MNLAKTGLSKEVPEKLNAIFKKYPEIKKVLLYGSRAKGNYKPGSDIDLAVFSDSLSITQLLKIETEIDDLLLPYKVDLCIFSHIDNPDLIDHIHRVGIPFYPGTQTAESA